MNIDSDLLNFEQIAFLKDKTRFHHITQDSCSFLFDQRVSEIYQLGDLDRLLAADSPDNFNAQLKEIPGDEQELIAEFLQEIMRIPDKQVPLPGTSAHGITNLKLNTGSACNLDCRYCFKGEAHKTALSETDIYRAIDYIITDAGSQASSYSISFHLTSEPLLALELLEKITNYCVQLQKKHGKYIDIFFMTNGTIVNKEILNLMKKIRKEKWLCISIDGPAAVHDQLRVTKNGTGTYQTIVENIKQYKKANVKLIGSAVLTALYPRPWEIVEHLIELDFSQIQLKPIRRGTPYSFTTSSIDELMDGYTVYFDNLLLQILDGNMFIVRCLAADFALRPLWKIIFNQRTNIRCSWGLDVVSIDAQGDMWPCDAVMGIPGMKVGSLADGIDKQKFWIDHRCENRGTCRTCWARHICGGTCLANSAIMGEPLLAIDPVECRLNEFLIEKNLELVCGLMARGIDPAVLKKPYLMDREWLIET